MATQVVILRAVRDFVPHLARLKNAAMAFFNGLIEQRPAWLMISWKPSPRDGRPKSSSCKVSSKKIECREKRPILAQPMPVFRTMVGRLVCETCPVASRGIDVLDAATRTVA